MALRIQKERMTGGNIPDPDAFCREWGIDPSKLAWWRKRLSAKAPAFVELTSLPRQGLAALELTSHAPRAAARARLVIGDVMVEVDGLDEAAAVFLGRLVRELGRQVGGSQ